MRPYSFRRAMSRHSEPLGPQVSILLVDDDAAAIHLMDRLLFDLGNRRFATNGPDALRLAQEAPPDLILLDAEMPGMSGFDLLRVIKADSLLADVPVIIVTNHSGPEYEVSALQLGASDFITKPYSAPAVMARVSVHLGIKRSSDELRRAATTDGLTGLSNRRFFDEYLAHEWRCAERAGHPVSLLMLDVDHFKLFNDHYGHLRGDACLQQVADLLGGACYRPADLVARYGGEEFAILLPQTPRAGAELMGARILNAVQAAAIPHDRSPTARHVTVSIGIACIESVRAHGRRNEANGASLSDGLPVEANCLTFAADKALYFAKRAGRARYHFYDLANTGQSD